MYSLGGCTLYACLTRVAPFARESEMVTLYYTSPRPRRARQPARTLSSRRL